MNSKISAYGIKIDPVTMVQAVNMISAWLEDTKDQCCHYVVTPNVDHITRLDKDNNFRTAYNSASLVITDGRPVYYSLVFLGKPVPEVVPGSDLVPKIFNTWQAKRKKLKVFLLGGAPGEAKKAADNISKQWSCIEIVGLDCPPYGFEISDEENNKILKKIAYCNPDLLIIGLGAPKQELWIHKHHRKVKASTALCVGATIDFLAGQEKRAPLWVQKISLEWCYRMIREPKRLGRRYLKNFFSFPGLFWREWRSGYFQK